MTTSTIFSSARFPQRATQATRANMMTMTNGQDPLQQHTNLQQQHLYGHHFGPHFNQHAYLASHLAADQQHRHEDPLQHHEHLHGNQNLHQNPLNSHTTPETNTNQQQSQGQGHHHNTNNNHTNHNHHHHHHHGRKKTKRIRTTFTPEQLKRLEHEFSQQIYLVGEYRQFLAKNLGLTEGQVKVWFQNRRIKQRKLSLSCNFNNGRGGNLGV